MLHGLAVFAFKDTEAPVQSLAECSPGQLEYLTNSVRAMIYRPLNGRREGLAEKCSGEAVRHESACPIAEYHIEQIHILASSLGWSKGQLKRYLRIQFEVSEPRDLATSRNGSRCIYQLEQIRRKRRTRCTRAAAPALSCRGKVPAGDEATELGR